MGITAILSLLGLGEQALTAGIAEFNTIKADLSATDQATVTAAIATSGAALDAARKQLDADAA